MRNSKYELVNDANPPVYQVEFDFKRILVCKKVCFDSNGIISHNPKSTQKERNNLISQNFSGLETMLTLVSRKIFSGKGTQCGNFLNFSPLQKFFVKLIYFSQKATLTEFLQIIVGEKFANFHNVREKIYQSM